MKASFEMAGLYFLSSECHHRGMKPLKPFDREVERLAALRKLKILDTASEPAFDDLVLLAAEICKCPFGFVSLIDEKRQWFKAKVGTEKSEIPRETAICSHTILNGDHLFQVPNAEEDKRFFDNPFMRENPAVRFYAGFALIDPIHNLPVGTLCVMDHKPKKLETSQQKALEIIKKQVEQLFALRVVRNQKIENEIQEVIERQEYVLDGANLGSWDWWLETNIVRFDKRWCQMLGLDHHEVAHELKTWEELVHPDDKSKAYEDIKAHLSGKTDVYENIHRLKHTNGDWKWILDRGRISEKDKSGKPIRFTGIHFDISEYKKKEILSNKIQRIAKIGGWELDVLTSKTQWTSQTYEIHAIPESIPTDKIMGINFYPEAEKIRISNFVQECIQGQSFRQTFEFIDGNQIKKWVEVSGFPFKNAENKIATLVGTFQDVTEKMNQQKILEETQMKMAQSAKLASLGEMAASVAHEINNPLSVIKSNSQLLQPMIVDHPKASHKIEMMLKACSRIVKIVKGLQNFSRIENSHQRQIVNLSEIINEVLFLVEVNSKFKAVELRLELIAKEAMISCDSSEIEQVMLNLVNNAVDAAFVTEEKWVKIQLTESEDFIFLRVIDSGGGIPPEVEKKIFDPFFTTKPVGQGTGLGLSICKGILESHQARFFLNRSFKNTCFEVAFSRQDLKSKVS